MAGLTIYRDGRLASGGELRALRGSDSEITGPSAACAQCHQRSGMGLTEGAIIVPPVTGPALFTSAQPHRAVPRRAPGMTVQERPFQQRPPYDDATLARAIIDGVASDGRPLGEMMPRYRLSPEDLSALLAYIHALSATPSPGASELAADFATVIAPDMEPEAERAYLDVLSACFAQHHPTGDTAGGARHQAWRLHVWRLEGDAATWEQQLAGRYALQPVFAAISGLGRDEWMPVERFCDAEGLPCLFPNVEVPGRSGAGYYSFYFSRGVLLEADVAARYLLDHRARIGVSRVMQISRPDGSGRRAADALAAALQGKGLTVEQRVLDGDAANRLPGVLADLGPTDALVAWLGITDLRAVAGTTPTPPRTAFVLLSGTLTGQNPELIPGAWRAAARLLYPYDAPDRWNQRMNANLRPWLTQHGLLSADERLQGNTLAACNVLYEGMLRLRGQFVRDYLVELTENYPEAMGNAPAPEAFPRFSLGPGQRFSSKGAYITRFAPPDFKRMQQVEDWIVP